MTKARRRLVIALIVIAFVAGIASEMYRFFERRTIAREAAQAKSTALASTSPATAPEDARRWLESNGYRVIVWNPHDSRGFVGMQENSEGKKHVIVQGQRQIRNGDWLVKPTWLDLTFRFSLDGMFHDVQTYPSPLKFPATQPAR